MSSIDETTPPVGTCRGHVPDVSRRCGELERGWYATLVHREPEGALHRRPAARRRHVVRTVVVQPHGAAVLGGGDGRGDGRREVRVELAAVRAADTAHAHVHRGEGEAERA